MSELTAIFNTLEAQWNEFGSEYTTRIISLDADTFDRVQLEILKGIGRYTAPENFSLDHTQVQSPFGALLLKRRVKIYEPTS